MAAFAVKALINSPGLAGEVVDYRPGQTIYSQGDPSDTVLYILQGSVKLTVLSPGGKEAIVGILAAGEFFGEGALSQPARAATATAMSASRIRVVPEQEMSHLLHQQPQHPLSDCFIAHMLARITRLEEDLVDQRFNACEKRLARTLLLLARDQGDGPRSVVPTISQGVLAEMVGTTRSRVNLFMNKFRKLGFIDYDNDGLKIYRPLLSFVRSEAPASSRWE